MPPSSIPAQRRTLCCTRWGQDAPRGPVQYQNSKFAAPLLGGPPSSGVHHGGTQDLRSQTLGGHEVRARELWMDDGGSRSRRHRKLKPRGAAPLRQPSAKCEAAPCTVQRGAQCAVVLRFLSHFAEADERERYLKPSAVGSASLGARGNQPASLLRLAASNDQPMNGNPISLCQQLHQSRAAEHQPQKPFQHGTFAINKVACLSSGATQAIPRHLQYTPHFRPARELRCFAIVL